MGRLKPPCEKQDDDDNQNDAEDADAAMTIAIAVATEAATEPTEQRDDQDDDEDKSKRRHGAVLPPGAAKPDFPYIRLCGLPGVDRLCNRVRQHLKASERASEIKLGAL